MYQISKAGTLHIHPMIHFKWILFFLFSFTAVFTTGQAPYNVYHGNLHSHTSYSDGVGTPRQAFNYARDSAKIDFLAVTDHLEYIYNDIYEWDSTKIMADEATVNGVFFGIAGYEWTSFTYNHCSVFNTPNLIPATNQNDWNAFLLSVIDELPAFGQFNHPGLYGNQWNQFTNMGILADSAFSMIEIRDTLQESYYRQALDSNWHVSPCNNQDNHQANWGTLSEACTGIWSTQLSRNGLFDAIIAGRIFASQDKNAGIWIDINGYAMGSSIPYSINLPLHIYINDPDSEIWSSIQVTGTTNQQFLNLYNHDSFLDTIIYINPYATKWIYVRALQYDYQYIISAPLYFSGTATGINEEPAHIEVLPNPLCEMSGIVFTLMKAENVEIDLFDSKGQFLISLCNQKLSGGNHTFHIPSEVMNQGIYFLRYSDDQNIKTLKLIR
ncbi:MAG: T9SS type A sorting domain-containing protein [Bacteroidota bacterium]